MADLAVVQTDTFYGDNQTSLDFDLPSAPTVGNTLIVFIGGRDGTAESSIGKPDVDWVNIIDQGVELGNSNARRWTYAYIKPVETGDDKTHSFTGMNTDAGGIMYEIEGEIELDKTAQTDSGTGQSNTRSSGTTATTTAANELLIAMVTIRHGTQTPSWDNSFVSRANLTTGGGQNNATLDIADRAVTSTGAYETTASWADSNENNGCIATFKVVGGAALSETVTDDVDVTDDTTTAKDSPRTVIEAVGVTDDTTRVHDAVRFEDEAVGVTDIVTVEEIGSGGLLAHFASMIG